jgi:hypothetical protein
MRLVPLLVGLAFAALLIVCFVRAFFAWTG